MLATQSESERENLFKMGAETQSIARYLVQVTKRIISRETGERHVLKRYKTCCDVLQRPGIYEPHTFGSIIYCKAATTGEGSRVGGRCGQQQPAAQTIRTLDLAKQ